MAKRGRPRKRKTSQMNTTDNNNKPETSNSITSKNQDNHQSDTEDLTFPSPKRAKKDSFDELLDNQYQNVYLDHDATKFTYTNRKSHNNSKHSEYHDEHIAFVDNTNRDMIVKWLNDNRNVFDRLTQTQETCTQRKTNDMWLDMPSVSQNHSKISPNRTKSNRNKKKTQNKRDPDKPRAKSLDIVITKDTKGHGRVKRHSIALGDRKLHRNDIERVNRDSEDVKIVKMMEEEYLNSLDEVLRDYNKNGWDRMENIKKTIQKTMRETKLDITLHNTPQPNLIIERDDESKSLTREELINFDYPQCNLSEFEDFACKNIEQSNEIDKISNCCGYHNGAVIESNQDYYLKSKIVEKCENFIDYLENLQINELSMIEPYYRRIQAIFNKNRSDKATQDCLKPPVENAETQTNPQQITDKATQFDSKPLVEDATTQDYLKPNVTDVEIQTESPIDQQLQDSQVLECFNFETEDFLKQSQTVIENKVDEHKSNTPTSTSELVLMLTRPETLQTTIESDRKQRPCEKFIPDDLSIAFDSEDVCKVEEAIVNKKRTTQDLIEECNVLIQNVTYQKLPKIGEVKRDSDGVFEENSMFINEENMSKIDKDIDLFEANCENKENIERTSNSSGKNLFGRDDLERTLIPDQADKINIIENLVLKSPEDDVIVSSQQDVDIVDTTPEKRLVIYDKRDTFLDITLPPPLEFQDICDKRETPKSLPTNHNKKYKHSTPNSNRFSSDFISLSPITIEKHPLELVGVEMRPTTPTLKRSQRSILNYFQTPSRSQSQEVPRSQKPCIACTRLSSDQLLVITALTHKKLATYSSTFSQKVTHMIVSVNDENRIKDHTIKYVQAVAAGIWVLNFKWIQECVAKNCIVAEEPYEAIDMSGVDGPRQSRLRHATEPLLHNYKIFAAQPFLSATQQDVEMIVRLLGGKVVTHPESFLNKDGAICVIITEAKDTQDVNLYESWLELFKVITVDIEWLSRSVGQYRVLSLRQFSLCSDDSISSLGYPKDLLEEVPFQFSQD